MDDTRTTFRPWLSSQSASTPWGLHQSSMDFYFRYFDGEPLLFVRTEEEAKALLTAAAANSTARVIQGYSLKGEDASVWVIHPWKPAEEDSPALPYEFVLVTVSQSEGCDDEAFEVCRTFDFIADSFKSERHTVSPLLARFALVRQGCRAVPGIRPASGSIGRAALECY